MKKKSFFSKLLWLFNIVIYTYWASNFNDFLNGLSFINDLWSERAISSSIEIVNTKVSDNYPYEYCSIVTDVVYSDSTYYYAGTPMPTQAVIINTPIPNQQVNETAEPMTEQPQEIESATVISESKDSVIPQLTITKSDIYKENNYHVAIVAAGFNSNEEIESIMQNVESSFSKINIDFTYVNETVDLNFVRVAQAAVFQDPEIEDELTKKVRDAYPDVDSVVVIVNTNDWIGLSTFRLTVQSLDRYSIIHEIGHQIGMSDGYQDFYDPKSLIALPNNELFFLDSMPASLVKAIEELGHVPQAYLVGTCNGRDVYTFYESQNNIYGDYSPNGNPSWGNDSVFTPLQVIIMNNYIESKK